MHGVTWSNGIFCLLAVSKISIITFDNLTFKQTSRRREQGGEAMDVCVSEHTCFLFLLVKESIKEERDD